MVQRYTLTGDECFARSNGGRFVFYTCYEALEKDLAAANERTQAVGNCCGRDGLCKVHAEVLREMNKAMLARIAKVLQSLPEIKSMEVSEAHITIMLERLIEKYKGQDGQLADAHRLIVSQSFRINELERAQFVGNK